LAARGGGIFQGRDKNGKLLVHGQSGNLFESGRGRAPAQLGVKGDAAKPFG
jgi:hypothetical protein